MEKGPKGVRNDVSPSLSMRDPPLPDVPDLRVPVMFFRRLAPEHDVQRTLISGAVPSASFLRANPGSRKH